MKGFLWGVAGAIIGLIGGLILAAVVGDSMGRAMQISNFEGGRAYFIVFALMPLFGVMGLVLGAIMIHRRWRFNLGVLGVLLLLGAGFVGLHKEAYFGVPPQVEQVGNFALLTYLDHYEAGYNFAWLHYGLRYRGEPVRITPTASATTEPYQLFSRLMTITLPLDPTQPAFIVNTGIPDTPSQLYLVHEVAGQLETRYLCDSEVDAEPYWLDNAVVGGTATIAQPIAFRRALAGGRWLLLNAGCVFDAETLTAYHFPVASVDERAISPLAKEHPPLGFAPDQHSFVQVGFVDEYDVTTYASRRTVQLFVYDFIASAVYTLPVDTDRMYYTWVMDGIGEVDNLNTTWLDHHFLWQPQADGHERLVERESFPPLFPLGLRIDSGSDRAYRLQPVQAGMLDALSRLLVEEFGAQEVERDHSDDYGSIRTSLTFQIAGQQLVATYTKDDYSIPSLVVWQRSSPDNDGTLVTTIGERFDTVLQTGVYNELYDPSFLGNAVAE